MRARTIFGVAMALAVGTGAEAQVWDAPSFLPPRPGEDIGVYLTQPDGADFGIQGIWRQRGNLNLGVRAGFVDFGTGSSFLAAGETWGGILDASADFPVDVTWTLGAGAAFGDGATILSVPAGISVGRALVLSPLTFQAYVHPRLALVASSVGDNTHTDLEGFFDVGADLHLNEDWKVRLGVTLGGTDSFGLGLAYRFGRGVAVR